MIDEDVLVQSVIEATSEVFLTMLEMEVIDGLIDDTEDPGSGLISLVGITGDWGAPACCCSRRLCGLIVCGRMLGSDV